MKKVRELLRLKFEQGLSARQSSLMSGIGKTAGSEYIAGFKASGLRVEDLEALSDSDLLRALSLKKESANARFQQLSAQFPFFEKELKRTGVTLQLLWLEYQQKHPDGYSYSQFCYHYGQWGKTVNVSMHIEHKAGDKMFVDFAGSKLPVTNPDTGEITYYEVFMAVLGASQYAYIEAVATQTKADWADVNQNALRFFGGTPRAIVPDCLKSAVIKANKYEPVINQTYLDFARHYSTTILPARALHPKDKSLVEGFVRIAYQRIYAPLRDRTFFSLEELNEALWEQLELHNTSRFQHKEGSRKLLFEQVEKAELGALPLERYELREYLVLKVQYNHHVYFKEDKHYYSVPFTLTGKKVTLGYTNRNVEIYHDNLRVAFHLRNRKPMGYSTQAEHRPLAHQYVSEWTPERFVQWAQKINPHVQQAIEMLLQSKPHPEQAYRSCMGVLSLAKKYTGTELSKACQKAIDTGCVNYRFIANTLINKTFNMSPEEEIRQMETCFHENIRGHEYYQN